ncbi:SPW repeat protein [Rhizobium binae]|uniref:SPW repeat protein n=1 Tax=Rhizobium binae TaxID=1138190 RepID=UPI001C83C212|nr:SPW repeat protein [Rhizobium binae]MBX4962358.1 SPW repeat protein [Rhizobium binae]
MERPAFNDRMAQRLAALMFVMSAAFPLLLSDMEKLALSSSNLALCGLLLRTGRGRDVAARRWEQVTIATWLAVSPWVLGFDHVGVSLWPTVACAVLLFLPAAWLASRQETPQKAEACTRRSQWRRPF